MDMLPKLTPTPTQALLPHKRQGLRMTLNAAGERVYRMG